MVFWSWPLSIFLSSGIDSGRRMGRRLQKGRGLSCVSIWERVEREKTQRSFLRSPTVLVILGTLDMVHSSIQWPQVEPVGR